MASAVRLCSLLRALAPVLLVAALTAGAASATESTIYPGVGIGKVRLGMTRTQVERVLGTEALVNEQKANYLELGWNFGSWEVAFVAKGGTYHVVRIATTLRSQRTPKGVGPGASWPKVVRAYPGGRCTFTFAGGIYVPEYLVAHAGGTQTLYAFHDIWNEQKQEVTGDWVVEVHVRTPYVSLPEFAPNWRDQCAPGWAYTNVPGLKRQ